jgi:hypothetical protein
MYIHADLNKCIPKNLGSFVGNKLIMSASAFIETVVILSIEKMEAKK